MLPEAEGSIFNPRSQFFTIRTDPNPVNNLFIFFLSLKGRKIHASVTVTVVRDKKNPDRAKNQPDCRIHYRASLEKINSVYYALMLHFKSSVVTFCGLTSVQPEFQRQYPAEQAPVV